MSKFTSELAAEVSHEINEDGDYVRTVTLTAPLAYVSDTVGATIVAPAGFESDGASVPRAFWSRYPPFGAYLKAAVIHDVLCVQGAKGECKYSSVEAAAIFKEAIRVCGVGKFKAWKMWFAVRWFGPQWD